MKQAFLLFALIALLVLLQTKGYAEFAETDFIIDNHSGDVGSVHQGIPEPMVFDLVRPLGAKKGEVEINTLGRLPFGGRKFKGLWAPEIEMAIMDNVAIELELPFENNVLQDLKGAVQVTLPSHSKRYQHGIQVIGEYHLDDRASSVTPLYISAVTILPKLSFISINGVRLQNIGSNTGIRGLVNGTLFYSLSDKITLGLENNFEINQSNTKVAIFPQIHRELSKKMSLQVGVGMAQTVSSKFHPTLGLRLIRTL
jgi:hypothetical protein